MITSLIKKSTALLAVANLLGSLVGLNVSASAARVFPAEKLHALAQAALKQSSNSQISTFTTSNAPFIASDIDTSSSDNMNVIIQLNGLPAAVGQYAAKMGYVTMAAESTEQTAQSEQTAFINAAKAAGIPLKVNYQYNTVLNGMEVTVRADQIPQLAKIAGVKSIHRNLLYHPVVSAESFSTVTRSTYNYSFDATPLKQLGVDKAWEQGWTGKGLKVGVIDTGVDYIHPDLKGAYQGGYDSYFNDPDPYEDYPSPQYKYEGSLHGTHVSGTIAGRAVNNTDDFVQKGVAYEAELHDYKVMGLADPSDPKGPTEATGTSAQIINGIERAVKDHMDVINLSLGNSSEKDPNSPDSIAINNAVLAGVIAVIANGNEGSSGPYYYSMGSPASAQLAITVAASTSPSVQYSASVKSSVVANTYQPLNIVTWETNHTDFHNMFGSAPVDAVYVGLGKKEDYDSVAGATYGRIDGKIAFISRGEISFEEKVKTAKEHGAIGTIIFNGINKIDVQGKSVPDLSDDIPGRNGPIGSIASLGDSYKYIPLIDMPGTTGRAIARNLTAGLTFTFGDIFTENHLAGDTIAEFGSRGPNSDGNYGIKPDISAPGVNIYSTLPKYGKNPDGTIDYSKSYEKAYGRLSGTSMATPHIAGLALLLKQEHRDWSPFDIRAALANTADEIRNLDGTPYDVYSQGAGRANIAKAIKTPAVLQSLDKITIYDSQMNPITMPSEASSVSFGTINPDGTVVTEPLQLKNKSNSPLTYSAKVVMHPTVTSDPNHPIATPVVSNMIMTLSGLDAGSSSQITVAANEKRAFSLSAKAAKGAQQGVYEGEVLLENTAYPSLHLPFVIHVGDDSANNDFPLQIESLSNKKVYSDTPINIKAMLKSEKMNYIELDVFGIDEKFMGTAAQIYDIDDKTHQYKLIPSGEITFPGFDGSYAIGREIATGNNIVDQLPEGLYKIGIIAAHVNDAFQIDNEAYAFNSVIIKDKPAPINNDGYTPPLSPPAGGPIFDGGGLPGPVETGPKNINNDVLAAVIPQGQPNMSIASQTAVQGKQLTAKVTDSDIQKALEAAKQTPTSFVVGVTDNNSHEAQLKLSGSQSQLLKDAPKNSSIVFVWNDASVAAPVSALDSVPAGSDVTFSITKDADSARGFSDKFTEASIVGTPYAFEASSTVNGVSTPLALASNQPIQRSFVLEQGSGAKATGALFKEGDKFYAIPAKFTQADNGATIVTISRPGFSSYVAASRHMMFADIDQSWAKDQIQSLADKFILNGTSANEYSPKRSVTRAEFAAMLVRALGLQRQASSNPFSDVTQQDWFAEDVATAYQAGLVTGTGEGFKPNDEISRQDLTVMLSRAISLLNLPKPTGPVSHPYADSVQFSSYAQDSIQAVTDVGLMEGITLQDKFYFLPGQATTREAVAKVLSNLLKAAKLIN
ncbi:Serine protease, subtilisin family [Paenibacillus sp. yr247]|uniref:S8 family serine peptidase n=1 Tax=Paenibacillus sp. yr247 TaxID=1761880 RepID=UPI000882C9AE|nr:S8 family serine peptidase [Paenibacillus sp. yr247]SDP07075.1 Serine protease, subtilisin family [Paenibacillus sp. yr247]